VKDGLVQIQEVPQVLRQSTSGPMFGLSFGGKSGITIFKARVEQAIENILVKDGKLGALHDLCLELNHLTF
jgi:hypothetical protein